MERLTERNKDVVIMKNPKLANERLADFEDFMESLGLENLEELEHIIGYPIFVDGYDEQGKEINKIEFRTYKESFNEVFDKNKKLKQENQALKERWNKLEKYIKENIKSLEEEESPWECDTYMIMGEQNGFYAVFRKMQELEKD